MPEGGKGHAHLYNITFLNSVKHKNDIDNMSCTQLCY